MSPAADDRLSAVLRICQEAVAREAAERATYLDSACGDDAELRREVEALLAEQVAEEYLVTPPWLHAATLGVGQRLGPYEILSRIGAGGMGEVYKARDTRLGRMVALKVLPPGFSADPARRARLEREAKTIGGLSHPHICTLHDVGREGDVDFLVMEHLEGQTLATRLEKGPLPLDQALGVAAEIAEALSAAHRQGVVHRDLKPANVMLTKAGTKLLDFGLAKLTGHGERPAVSDLPKAGTLTGQGVILGTLQYMAPEQLEGRPADARTDLWALGAILYEMVTGKRPFEGTSVVSLMAAIMDQQPPPVTTLQPLTPAALDRLVKRCLAKSPDDRPDGVHDVADDLRWLREASGGGAQARAQRRRLGLPVVLVVAGVLLLIMVAAGLIWPPCSTRPIPPILRAALSVSPAEELNGGGVPTSFLPTPGGSGTALTWTPDARALVFVGRRAGVQQLYVRRLDAAEARPLADTVGAQVPAVSADGRSVAFWSNGAIRKVGLSGGPAMELASGVALPPWGLVWDDRGRVLFGRAFDAIWTVPPAGHPAAVTVVAEAEVAHALPWPLPGGQTILFTVRKRVWSWGDEEVVAQNLITGARKVLLNDAADARYLPTGHLLFLRRGVLFAVPFDAVHVQVLGKEVPVLDTVAQALTAGQEADITGAGQFAVAATGTLAWLPGDVVPYPDAALVTVDRRAEVSPLPAPSRAYLAVEVSPDGRRLAVTIRGLTEASVWIYDLGRGTLSLLARDGEASYVRWSPDGRTLVFDWLAGGRRALVRQPADGTAPPQALLTGARFDPSSFTPDGREVAIVKEPDWDILSVTTDDGHARMRPLIQTPHAEGWPAFSPDGRWLAYASDVSGRFEVYVRPFPGAGEIRQTSLEGGLSPAWHPNGRELFFVVPLDAATKRRMTVVDFAPGPPVRIGQPRVLFEFDTGSLYLLCTPVRCNDVARDGQRFFAVQVPPSPPPPVVTHINLWQNWFEELKAKVPPAR